MEESEENISADSTKLDDTLSSTKPKIKKRSLIERELETSLTARITSPVTYSDATSTSRYGRSRRLKTENDFIDTEKAVSKALKSPNVEKTPIKAQSPAHKMHATNSSAKKELMDVTPNKSGSVELNLSNQIENIYQENLMLSRFGSTDSNKDSTSPSKQAKVYVRKDLIQKRDKDEMVTLIKNLFTPSSAQKSPNNHLSNILERSSEKYTLEDSGTKQKSPICFTSTPSVVKTLDFDSNKKKPKDAKSILTKSELFDLEAKCEYQVGDLAWARMGTYPFWPCIVTREQSSGLFVKLKLFGRVERDLIHVTFFGDNGRHSWIVDSMLRKFLGQLEFEATREHFSPTTKKKDPKLYAAFCISEKKMPQWSISVEEAETLLREPKRLRLDIFNDMLIKSRNAKATTKSRKTVKLIRTDSDVSLSESLYDTLFSADNGKSDDPDHSRSKTRKSLDVSEVVTACLDNMAAKTGMTKIKKQSHMDRWLQKAKSKTPEKSQVKALPIKEKRATLSSSKKKKHQTTNKVPDKTPIKKSNESRKSSGKKPKDLDNSISDPVTSRSGIGVISKVESLRDKLADELSKAVAEMEYLENDHVETYENYSLKVPEISVPVSESPTFTQSFDDFNRNESENVRAPMVMETHISIERDMSDDNMFDETEQSIIESADPPEASSEDISDVNSAMDTCSASFLFMNGHIDDSISENSILGRHNSVRKLRGPKISNEICRHIDISIDIDVSRDTSNNKEEMSVDADHNSSKETSICNGLEITVNSEDRSLNSSLKSVKSVRGRKATRKKRISFTCLSKSTPKKQNLRKKNRKSDETPKEDSFTRYLELRQDAIIDEHPELTKVEVVEYLRKAWQYEQNVTADPANDGEIRKNREEKGPQNAAVITVTKIADYEPKICTVKLNDVLQNNKYSRTHNNITSDSNPLKYKDCVEINNDISNITSETSNTVNIESSVSGDAISSNNETKIPLNDNSEVLDDNSLNNPQLSCISKLDDEARKKIINEIVLGKCESEESKFNSDIINDDDKVHITTDTLDKSEETSCDIETHIKSDSIKTNSNVTDNDIDPNVLVSKLDMDVDNNKLTLQEKNKADAESIKSNTIKEKLEEKSVDLVKLVVNEKESIEQNKDELGLIECNRQIISNDADVCIDSIDLNENVQLERICADSPEDDCHKGKNEFSLSYANNNCKEDINESSNLDAIPDHIHDAVLVSKEIDNVTKECFETTDVLYNSNDTVKIDINDDVETFNEQAAVEDIICENDTGNLMDNKDFPNAVATENVVKEIHSLVSEECVEIKDINNDVDEIDAIEPVDTHLVEETDIMEVVEDVKNMEKEDDGTTNDDVINEECIEKDALYSASEEVNYLQELNNSEKSVNSNVKISTTVSSPSQKESIQNTVEGLPSEVQIQDQNHRHEICIELATDADAAANNVNTTEANEQVLIKEMNNIDHVIEENYEHETETSKELIKKQEAIAPHNSDVNDTEKSMLPKELPEPIKVNGFHCDHENGPDFSDSELTAETASIHSEDSEPLSKVKYNLSLKKRKTKVPLQEPEFLKYMELRQDALVDEHPELSQDQIVEYMYKTWQYEENCKSDLMKNDEIEQIGIVKGLNEDLRQKSIRNSFRESRKRKKQNDDDAMSVSSDNSDSIPKKSLRVRLTRSPLITLNDCWKKQSKENSPERKADDADEVISVNSDASDQPLTRNLRKKKEAASTEIIEVDSSSTSSKQAQNVEDIKESVAEKEKSPSPSSNESTKPKRYFDVFKQSIKEHLTDEKKQETNVKKIKDEFDPETASINSEDSECSSIKRKPRKHGEKSKQDMDNPEFLKYFELRQDQLLEENPDLTQEEITSYLYKTWLYEESVKSDLMKTDELEQANLVKGLSTEVSQVRKPRKKIKTEKEASSENDIQKDKPKRKTSQPYYNEDLSDMEEDDIEVFDIFKPKSKHLGPKLENGEPEIGDIVDLEEDYVDEVELYFAELTKPKPNLFKGLVREKVCDICERTGNLVKCKGCNNAFHVECVKKMAEVVAVPTTPARGRKKKKKPGRKPKNLDESESQSDEKSQDISEENNASIDDIVEPETWVVDADNFEAVLAAKMQELIPSDPNYDSYSCEESINWKAAVAGKCEIIDVKSKPKDDYSNFKCKNCLTHDIPVCFVCKNALSKSGVDYRQRCQTAHCNKYYHMECLDHWPQTQFKAGELSKNNKKGNERFEEFMCPRHVCHTCVSDDPRGCKTRFSGDKLARCVRCPATYHTFTKCLPAGSQILTGSHIVCPRHYDHRPGKVPCHVNTGWCFLCALGGSLICCEYCPTSFHAECLNIKPPEGGYMCEDCETGRLPLYGEMVWVKLGHYRWWPGLILHPKEIPDNIMAVKHSPGEFVVRFFGQYDHYWVNRGRVFPFQEGDTGRISSQKSKIDAAFTMAIEHAQRACEILKAAEPNEEEDTDIASSLLPPHYVKLKVNKPVGSLCGRRIDIEESSLTQCECNPDEEDPCGLYSQCLNRMLLTECGPLCRAGDRCSNRAFEKRQYPRLAPYKTPHRGWGLKTLQDIKAGQFVIEYVGELIDEEEFRRRMNRKHEIRDENYYFLTLDKERMIDAGPKGNLARFMNHCCEPNCETQKWTVLGDVRVGLFAMKDIPANSELTFNYNLECAGIEKKRCLCGAKRCSGYMGAKPKQEETQPKKHRPGKRTYKKRKNVEDSPSTVKNKPKRPVGRPMKPRELTEIEKDLLIIKNATNGLSSDSEGSSRLSSVEQDRNSKALKRKRVSFSTDDVSPSTKKPKVDEEKAEVGD